MVKISIDTVRALLEPHGKIVVAFSGGMDSHVLLHAVMAQLPQDLSTRVHALHIHHGLSENADYWSQHCQQVCAELNVPLEVEHVTLDPHRSLEEEARRKRYQVFEQHVAIGDLLLQGHHANDQTETLLFRLERGAGWRGIQGIPERRTLGGGQLWRPLLSLSRSTLEAYAQQCQLHWIEDESNADTRFRRNFLRHQVIQPWQNQAPNLTERVAQSAQRMQSDGRVLERLVVQTLHGFINDMGGLNLTLIPFDERVFWFSAYLFERGVSLTQAQLKAVVDMFYSVADKQPCYQSGDYRLVRSSAHLYVLPAECEPRIGQVEAHVWFERPFDRIRCSEKIELRPRPHGVCLTLANGQHRSLKKWLQDQAVPAWWRDHVPYIYQGETLIAIGNLWRHPECSVNIEWHKNRRLCWPK